MQQDTRKDEWTYWRTKLHSLPRVSVATTIPTRCSNQARHDMLNFSACTLLSDCLSPTLCSPMCRNGSLLHTSEEMELLERTT